jgi:predicted component of type VI protein secretion system
LFEQMDPFTISALDTQIRTLLENFEPRVQLTDLNINASDDNSLRVTIHFSINNSVSDEIHTFETLLERIK